MIKRKYLPSFADLIDRLSIDQLKEVFIPLKKEEYREEISKILYDLDLIIKDKHIKLTSRLLRAIIVISQINTHIWYNESSVRNGDVQDLKKLRLTHSINGIRNYAKNVVLQEIKEVEGQDYKIDCLAADFKQWDISL